MRHNYWSNSKFADKVRGIDKPISLPMGQWSVWEEDCKKEKPIRFWLSDTALDALQNFLYWPHDQYSKVCRYLRNRFISKTHTLQTRLKKGQWHEFEERLLCGCFEALVDFVEVEIGMGYKPYRSRQRGLEHLEWESNLEYDKDGGMGLDDGGNGVPTPQALTAIKIRELYLWWKDTRPNRPDPWDLVKRAEDELSYEERYGCMDLLTESYHQEDEERLIELIKLRQTIWS